MSESNVVTPPDSFTIAILEAALAERDARIAELEALVQKMKCCQNCTEQGRSDTLCHYILTEECQEYEKWRMK